MLKKIKEKNITEEKEKKIEFDLNLKNSVKRGIGAVLLFLLAILFSAGFLGAGGAFGVFLNKIGGIVFGWGKWLFPLTLILIMTVLLFKKKTVFYVVKIAGLSIAFLSMLGFFHIFYDQKILLEIAQSGQGGGYVGYFVALGLIKLTGKIVGILVLLSFLAIGIMIAFNFSIVEFLIKLLNKNNIFKKDESSEEDLENNSQTEIEEAITTEKEKSLNNSEDLKYNIKEVKFVEGPSVDKNENIENEEDDSVGDDNFNIKSVAFENKSKSRKDKDNKGGASKEWKLPSLNLLDDYEGKADGGDIEKRVEAIKDTFANFGIELEFKGHKTGPSVTQYSFSPATGVKLSKIMAFTDDLALALAAHPIRIEAPIPGKSLIGIEVPNEKPIRVRLREALESKEFTSCESKLALALGKNVEGTFVVEDLAEMPHLLIAGATGTGKSVCINSLILSLLFRNSPEDLRMILVDPKRVELSLYNKIPHLLSDVITDNKKVINALRWAVREMEERYKILESAGSRDLKSYNKKLSEGLSRKFVDTDTSEVVEEKLKKLPAIVIVIDELADLMLSYGKDVEGAIMRLAQMARAVGIHLIISTQRPSVDIITGIIKANITNKIALQVNNQIDSRTIIDMRGAENLLGRGDLLFASSHSPKPKRLQNSFVSENEVKRVVEYIREQAERTRKENEDDALEGEFESEISSGATDSRDITTPDQMDFSISQDNDDDNLYNDAKNFVFEVNKASASLLQRRFRIGYNRAARLIDCLERDGIVGPADGAKPREVLISKGSDNVSSEKDNKEDDETTQEQRDKWQI
jgi:S-DNA-T family DNA segregation ATPase FtsK/SpoIIIE